MIARLTKFLKLRKSVYTPPNDIFFNNLKSYSTTIVYTHNNLTFL